MYFFVLFSAFGPFNIFEGSSTKKTKKNNFEGSNKETCGSHQGGKRIALNKTAAMKAIQQEGRVVFIFLHNVESWGNVGVFKECGNL